MQDTNKSKKLAVIASIIILIIVVAVELYVWVFMNRPDSDEVKAVTEAIRIEDEADEAVDENEVEWTEETPEVDFQDLISQNADVYAYVYVPGTDVSYPILQNSQHDYYLRRGIDGRSEKAGCIYTNAENSKDFNDNVTVIYGHDMRDGSMFGSLRNFYNGEFYSDYDKVIIITPESKMLYKIVAARRHDDAYLYDEYAAFSEGGMERFVQMATADISDRDKDVSHVSDIEVSTDDKYIVLSTCIGDESTNRYLVIGKLILEADNN